MNKKIFLLVICLIFITACNNQNKKVESPTNNLCNQIKNDITNYQNNNLTKEELYSKLENYNEICSNSKDNICINLKAMINVQKVREELQKEFLNNLLDNCQSEKN